MPDEHWTTCRVAMTVERVRLRSSQRSRRGVLIVTAAGALALTGCGNHADAGFAPSSAEVVPAAHTSTTARARNGIGQRLTRTIQSSDTAGVRLSPPPEDATFVPMEVARDEVAKAFGASTVDPMQPWLATFDHPAGGDHGRLVWAFVQYRPCSEFARGHGPPGFDPPPIDPALQCIWVIIADAHTGAYVLAYSEAENAREMVPDDLGQPGTQLAP